MSKFPLTALLITRPAVLLALVLAGPAIAHAQGQPAPSASPADEASPDRPATPPDIVVTASRRDLVGVATTASQGSLTQQEVELRPIYRPGQIFESIPGLVVTVHSGEGKAPQYLIRGYNLDHGTDFANFVDDMPVNRPSNAHGQGYSDLGFLIPQLVGGIDYTKGPYFAGIGDFGSVASAHTHLIDTLPAQVTATVGSDGFQSLFAGGTIALGPTDNPGDKLLGAIELAHYDGPWQPPEDFRKINAALRYTRGGKADNLSLTALYYRSSGGLITDQPQRAIDSGAIGRFGTLDTSDHSASLRYSLSAHVEKPLGPGRFALSLYAIHSTMTLWNNFTHFLFDPVNGDQEQQDESRTTLGLASSFSLSTALTGIPVEASAGLQVRHDAVLVDRKHTLGRTTILPICQTADDDDGGVLNYAAVAGNCTADRVHLLSLSPYLEATVHPAPWLRLTGGLRLDHLQADDRSSVTGTSGKGSQTLLQPKGSVAIGPWARSEMYFSIGKGFHSNDARGVFGTVPSLGSPLASGNTPLMSTTTGFELGLRTGIVPRLSIQVAAFQQDFGSELVYNPDLGSDEAGAPSRRQGIEVSAQYHPFRWLELNTDLAFAKPRYRASSLAAFELNEPYIADAPNFIYSFGILVDRLGPWSGGLQWRGLGTHSLDDGNRLPQDRGYSEWNLDVALALRGGWKLQVGVFNIFNSHDEAADYYYTSRLAGEPAGGVSDFQIHPLEPRSARLSLTKMF